MERFIQICYFYDIRSEMTRILPKECQRHSRIEFNEEIDRYYDFEPITLFLHCQSLP